MKWVDSFRGLFLGLVLYSPHLGTLLWLVAYFLDGSDNLDHKSFFSRVSRFAFFGLGLHTNGAPALSGGVLCRVKAL